MNLQNLLKQRQELLRRKRLADLAFAYHELGHFAARIATGGVHGLAVVHPVTPENPVPWPAIDLVAGNPAVLDEHFTEEDLLDLADLVRFATAGSGASTRDESIHFDLREVESRFRTPLRDELEAAGVDLASEGEIADGISSG